MGELGKDIKNAEENFYLTIKEEIKEAKAKGWNWIRIKKHLFLSDQFFENLEDEGIFYSEGKLSWK